MKTITDIIQPIALLSGSHADVGQTGRGCFMNVIAYLNGEAHITDKSDCVCYVVRPIAIWLNDFANNEQRARMIPLIERAIGSRTDDRAEISRRLKLVVVFAKYAAKCAECAECAAKCAKYAAKYAVECAAECAAKCGAKREELFAAGFKFMDEALPKSMEPSSCVIERAQKLVKHYA